jgi:hypothetical protein
MPVSADSATTGEDQGENVLAGMGLIRIFDAAPELDDEDDDVEGRLLDIAGLVDEAKSLDFQESGAGVGWSMASCQKARRDAR